MRSYEICLADYESVLPALARLLNAKYEVGAFLKAEERFHEQRQPLFEWQLSGEFGRLSVKLEEHEGYYFSTFEASDKAFEEGKNLLWQSYLEQGGNPNAQERP
ncbi:MAG: hypothetical protein ACK5VU_07765 [Burkholderiales bacterium]|jgi:hypothetical protein